jgi:uncharacterized protein YcfJ
MARSHHRKKHKQHLQQFKQSHDTSTTAGAASRSSAKWVFAIAGAILGFAVSYFATGGNMLWVAAATVAGCTAGYFIGKKIDDGKG